MRRHIILRLRLIKLRIDSMSFHQRLMRSLLRDFPVVKHDNTVTEFTAAHAVGNIDCSFIFYHLIKVLVDLRLSDRI